MIVRQIDRDIIGTCSHSWEDHHHGCVMNLEYETYPLNIDGCIGQECEYNQRYGQYFPKKGEKPCMCSNFKPRSMYIKNLVKAWIEAHPRKA